MQQAEVEIRRYIVFEKEKHSGAHTSTDQPPHTQAENPPPTHTYTRTQNKQIQNKLSDQQKMKIEEDSPTQFHAKMRLLKKSE